MLLRLALSRLSELPVAWAAQSTSPLTYATGALLKLSSTYGLCPETHCFPVAQFATGVFFAHVLTPRGTVDLCLLLLEVSVIFLLFTASLPAHQLLKTPPPYRPAVFFLVHSNSVSLLSPQVPSPSQLISSCLLPSCAILQSR